MVRCVILMMKKQLLTVLLLTALFLNGQTNMAHRLVIGLTLGLNDPFRDYNVGTYPGQLTSGNFFTKTISGTTVLPPISLDFDLTTSDRFALGLSMIFQSHREAHTFRNTNSQEVFNYWDERHVTTTAIFGAKYFWLGKPNFHLGSGLGIGGSFLTVHGPNPDSQASLCLDFHPIFIRYEVCCGWFVNLDARVTTGPLTDVIDDIVGYNVGLGVIYAFQTPSSN